MTAKNAWYVDFLACPDCGRNLDADDDPIACRGCGFKPASEKPLDLRPHSPTPLALSLSRTYRVQETLANVLIERPSSAYDGPKPTRDSSEFIGAIRSLLKPGLRVLDLGCGPRDQAVVFDHLGCQYVGIDYENHAADILADAHAIPFRSQSFDIVFSYAVLQHLHNPHVAIAEVDRVLKPGGIYCGTVSQGEQFISSYFHMTPWGVLSLMGNTSLMPKQLWHSYDTLRVLAKSGRYPRLIKLLLGVLDRINANCLFLAPRKWLTWPSAPGADCLNELSSRFGYLNIPGNQDRLKPR